LRYKHLWIGLKVEITNFPQNVSQPLSTKVVMSQKILCHVRNTEEYLRHV